MGCRVEDRVPAKCRCDLCLDLRRMCRCDWCAVVLGDHELAPVDCTKVVIEGRYLRAGDVLSLDGARFRLDRVVPTRVAGVWLDGEDQGSTFCASDADMAAEVCRGELRRASA